MPGGGDPVGGGVRARDDGRGTFLPGASERTDAMQGLRGGYDGWIDGRAHEGTTWTSGRGDMKFVNLGHRGRTVDILHRVPVQGKTAELPD